jgi:peptidoglycan-associated lipoprotein
MRKLWMIALVPALILGAYGCAKKAEMKTPATGQGQGQENTGFQQEGAGDAASRAGGGGTPLPLERVYFEYDRATLTASAKETLKKDYEILKANSGAKLVIEGHCDERGSVEYNLSLGERRAESVKNYLVQLGLAPASVSTISYGEERPLVNENSEAAWTKNRRGELVGTK